MARRKSGLERLVGGLTSGAVIYGLWFFHVLPVGWAIGLGVVFGVLPILTGLRHGAREIADRSHDKRKMLKSQQKLEFQRTDSSEKTVLQIARQNKGVVTPALVVLDSELKLEEAEAVLNDLAKRGYAELRIKDNGTLDYLFPELAN